MLDWTGHSHAAAAAAALPPPTAEVAAAAAAEAADAAAAAAAAEPPPDAAAEEAAAEPPAGMQAKNRSNAYTFSLIQKRVHACMRPMRYAITVSSGMSTDAAGESALRNLLRNRRQEQ